MKTTNNSCTASKYKFEKQILGVKTRNNTTLVPSSITDLICRRGRFRRWFGMKGEKVSKQSFGLFIRCVETFFLLRTTTVEIMCLCLSESMASFLLSFIRNNVLTSFSSNLGIRVTSGSTRVTVIVGRGGARENINSCNVSNTVTFGLDMQFVGYFGCDDHEGQANNYIVVAERTLESNTSSRALLSQFTTC